MENILGLTMTIYPPQYPIHESHVENMTTNQNKKDMDVYYHCPLSIYKEHTQKIIEDKLSVG